MELDRDTNKLDKVLDNMIQDGIGAWMLQDTWQEGYNFDKEVNGFQIFDHNYYIGSRGDEHLWKGVGIILSTFFYQTWKYSVSLPPITTDTKGKYGGGIIVLTLKLQSYDTNGKLIRGGLFKPFVVSAYHP